MELKHPCHFTHSCFLHCNVKKACVGGGGKKPQTLLKKSQKDHLVFYFQAFKVGQIMSKNTTQLPWKKELVFLVKSPHAKSQDVGNKKNRHLLAHSSFPVAFEKWELFMAS